jgi:hypothetical protein
MRLLVAAVFGAMIGLAREIHGHQAGVRTHMLVSLGSAIFTVLSIYGFHAVAGSGSVDPSRISAQIVTGIGFLGAGAIIKFGTNIRGLTTAASLWVVAAVGLAPEPGPTSWRWSGPRWRCSRCGPFIAWSPGSSCPEDEWCASGSPSRSSSRSLPCRGFFCPTGSRP